jgi:hypothetical protein
MLVPYIAAELYARAVESQVYVPDKKIREISRLRLHRRSRTIGAGQDVASSRSAYTQGRLRRGAD